MTIKGLWTVGDVVENEWKVLKILGGPRESGFGIVYVLRNLINGSVDAAKTFQQLLEEDTDDLRSRFRSEARIWNRLAGHPNIVEPKGVFEFVGLPFMMSEYIEEGDLSLSIRAGLFTDRLAEVCDLGMQVCDGLTYALQHGVKAHLDMKPTNCLLKRGHLKICDFGLARTLDGFESKNNGRKFSTDALTLIQSSGGLIAGTPLYMAPEQIHSPAEVDHRADIFSVGLMLLEMITGSPPRRVAEELPTGESVRNGKFRSVVKKCFSPKPEARFQTFPELREALSATFQTKTGKPAHKGVVELNLSTLRKGKDDAYYTDLHSTHPTLLQRVIDLISTNDTEELEKLGAHVEEQLKLFPNSYHLKLASAQLCQFLHHDRLAAISHLEDATRVEGIPSLAKAVALFDLGVNLIGIGKHAKAADALQEAIQLDPAHGDTHYYLGLTFQHRLKFEEARACFEEAVRLNPDSEDSYTLLGRVLNNLGKDDEAESAYRRGLSRLPRSVQLAHYLSLSLMQQNHIHEAIEVLESATSLSPEAPNLHDDLACAHLLDGNLLLAEETEALFKTFSPPHDSSTLVFSAGVCVEAARQNNWTLCHKMVRELLEMRLYALDIEGMRGESARDR